MKQTQRRIQEAIMTKPTFDNLIPQQCKKTQNDDLRSAMKTHALIPTLSRPEPTGR